MQGALHSEKAQDGQEESKHHATLRTEGPAATPLQWAG